MSATDRILVDIENRAAARYPDKTIDLSDIEACDPYLILAVDHRRRVKVRDCDGRVRHGRVGVTTGWKPALLLMARSTSTGSTDVLGPNDRVIAIQDRPGGLYRTITPTP